MQVALKGPDVTDGSCVSQQPIRASVQPHGAGPNRAAPVPSAAGLAAAHSESCCDISLVRVRNVLFLCNSKEVKSLWGAFVSSSSARGRSKAGGGSQRPDVPVPAFGRVQHQPRPGDLRSPVWTTGESWTPELDFMGPNLLTTTRPMC